MHVHSNEDEWLVVTEGEVTFYAGELVRRGGRGTFAYFRRGIPHTFVVESGSAEMLVLVSPGGFMRMVERALTSPDEAIAVQAPHWSGRTRASCAAPPSATRRPSRSLLEQQAELTRELILRVLVRASSGTLPRKSQSPRCEGSRRLAPHRLPLLRDP